MKFPFATRYSFYASWVQAPSIHSELQFLTILLKKQVKSLLKRISVDNVKDFSRSLTRLAYNNPLVVVDLLLDQLEMFDNFCELCAEVMTYFTSLNLDVVCFILLKHLSVVGRPKVKEDGFNPSQWLQGLFTFTGAFFKKFPEVLFSNPSVIEYALNYVSFPSFTSSMHVTLIFFVIAF